MTQPTFRLFWPREAGCDAGTLLGPGELPPAIREQVMELTGGEARTFDLRLPFCDRRDRRRLDALLGALPFEREGTLIRAVLEPMAAARDMAAALVMGDPVWLNTPGERDAAYFPTWQRVSLALQRWLREQAPARYFADMARFADRKTAYPMIVYQASRPFPGRPRTEFTYDLRDYPWCRDTLEASWRLCGRSVQRFLAVCEGRLYEAGELQLAHRYAPVWHEDILVAVQRKSKAYADLLARESEIINAVVDLGTLRTVEAINRFARIAGRSLRKMHNKVDMRALAPGLLEVATAALSEELPGGDDDIGDLRAFEHTDARSARSPDGRVGREEDGDDRYAHRRGEVGDARVIADVHARAGQPAGEFI